MESCRLKLENALQLQVDQLNRDRSTRFPLSAPSASAQGSEENIEERQVPKNSSDDIAQDPVQSALDESIFEQTTRDSTPLSALRDMLRAYMSQERSTSHKESGFIESRNEGLVNVRELGETILTERKLIQVLDNDNLYCYVLCFHFSIFLLFKELKVFLKKENEVVRRRQQSLARDREEWRAMYQQRGQKNRNSESEFRVAKKVYLLSLFNFL